MIGYHLSHTAIKGTMLYNVPLKFARAKVNLTYSDCSAFVFLSDIYFFTSFPTLFGVGGKKMADMIQTHRRREKRWSPGTAQPMGLQAHPWLSLWDQSDRSSKGR